MNRKLGLLKDVTVAFTKGAVGNVLGSVAVSAAAVGVNNLFKGEEAEIDEIVKQVAVGTAVVAGLNGVTNVVLNMDAIRHNAEVRFLKKTGIVEVDLSDVKSVNEED